LVELQPTDDGESQHPLEPGEQQIPDWLSELQPTVTGGSAELEEDDDAGQPADWLVGLQADSTEEEIATEPEEEARPLDTLPAVLSGAGLAALAMESEEEDETPPSGIAADEAVLAEDMPEWLAEMAPSGSESVDTEDASAEDEIADWLVPTGMGQGEDESLEKAEIPSWLMALKPQELRVEEEEEVEASVSSAEEVVEETGLLAGIKGTLTVEMLIAQPRAATPPKDEIPPPTDSAASRLFADIVARPPTLTSTSIPGSKPDTLDRLPRLILYLALLLAVAVPLILGGSLVPRTLEANDALMGLYNTIDGLPSGARVLAAFDYDPATRGEMEVIAQSVLKHLADQKAQLVAVSLLPAGPATAQSVLEELAAEGHYVNLGYVPGQATAVRLMSRSMLLAAPLDYQGTPVSEIETLEGITTLSDFDLVIEFAATQESLRWWIEQRDPAGSIPLAAGVSASVEPLARTYYETDPQQLAGLVSGVPGAALYTSQHDGLASLPSALAARLDAQLAGHLVLILALVIGNILYLVRRRSGEEQ
jgi:hypothetical protein